MNIVKRYLVPLLYSTGFAALTLLAGCGGGDQGRDPILGIGAATLTSVTVTPATASIAAGNTQQFVATANYTDGSTRDVTTASAWTSATPTAATVGAATGLATGVAAGSSAISAAYNGQTGTASLTVTPPVLVSLAIAPLAPSVAVGATRTFSAIGTFSDKSVRDVSSTTTFASASPLVATIGATTGIASAKAAGTSSITATSGTLSASTVLTVTPATLVSIALTPVNPTVQILATRQLAATATYSDNSTADITALSTYVSATPAAATVSTAGTVQGVAGGSSVVTASFGGKTATTTVNVPAAVTLSSIAVTPAKPSIIVGAQQQFVATATYSDNSNAVVTPVWTSGTAATATIAANGVATGVAAGTSNITATLGGKSGVAVLTVTAAPVTPPPAVQGLNLGTAASFGVLAGTSITNNSGGTTLISGDVGAASQTTDPTQAAGYVNLKSGAVLAGALADLQVAITDARSRTCDVTFAGDIDLGGLTLAPGVYCYAGAINITGTLTLNGSGLYIFRTALTLNTAANSIVALNNGATAANVNWVPVGPTTLGANSVFKGNILGQAAAITLGDNATLVNGRVLTGAAVTLRNNQIAK